MSENKPVVKIRDVLITYWKGIREYKVAFFYAIFSMIVGNIIDLLVPLQYKKFFDVISANSMAEGTISTLLSIILIVLGLNITRWAFFRSSNFTINYFESRVMARLREIAFNYTIDHSYSFFSNNFSGAIVQKIGRFIRAFEKIFDTLVYSFMPLLVTLITILIIVTKQEPRLAILLLCWAVVTSTISFMFSKWKLKYDAASAAADSRTTAYLADVITNQNTVSSFAASKYESKNFKEKVLEQARAVWITWNWGETMSLVQSGFIIIIEFLLFYFGIKYWSQGLITVGTFVLLQVYVLNLTQKLWNFSSIVRAFYEGAADAQEMVDILNKPYEVADTPNSKPLVVTGGQIEFKNVSFTYNNERKTLNEVDLNIRSGEKTALIGPSGAGKSTVVKLLLRMFNLEEGLILIDGQDIQKVTQESLRKNISLVPQDPILFHRSLMENIRYGRLDASDNEVIKAAQLAHCDEFIESLPNKYETFVGERGIKLSGGERQRVAIARAILKNAPILILDEATSSLDSHSESLIQDALNTLMKDKTVIVIAHRLSTIRKMDRIIVLEKGSIIEEGTHDDLVTREESLYKNLWNLQAGGFLVDE